MKKSKKKKWVSKAEHLALEIALIFAAVFIFRSLWLLMDKIPLLNDVLFLVLMLVLGTIVTIVCFDLIFRRGY